MHFPTRFAIPALAAVVSACADGALATAPGSGGARAVGILSWEARPGSGPLRSGQGGTPTGVPRPGVLAPDTVRAGTAFPVVVTTVGPTVCWQAAGAQVEMLPGVAAVTPFDSTAEDQWTSCGDALVELSRTLSVTFAQPGEAVLRVHGRKVIGDDFRAEERIMLEKRIHVR